MPGIGNGARNQVLSYAVSGLCPYETLTSVNKSKLAECFNFAATNDAANVRQTLSMVLKHDKPHIAKVMHCLKCDHELSAKPRRLPSGVWVLDCTACGATMLLKQHPDSPDNFSLGGLIVNPRRR